MRRRQFITRCSAACAAIGVVEVPGLALGAAGTTRPDREALAEHVGRRFRVYRDARFADALTLVRVAEGPEGTDLVQFTLVFRGTYRPDLEDGTYALVGPDGVPRDTFLEATGERTYRATFCQQRDPRTT